VEHGNEPLAEQRRRRGERQVEVAVGAFEASRKRQWVNRHRGHVPLVEPVEDGAVQLRIALWMSITAPASAVPAVVETPCSLAWW